MSGDLASAMAIYVHWPYCRVKCPYCDFNSYAGNVFDEEGWRDACRRELTTFAATTRGRRVTSVYFGGGTPSLMAVPTLGAILDEIARSWPLVPDVEITLEANPSVADAVRLSAYRDAGVNRLSLGVQALDDESLRYLGRSHTAREARNTIALADRLFPSFSFDLIYGWRGQTRAGWKRVLSEASRLAGDHLSVYELTIEPATLFWRQRVTTAEERLAAALYEVTQEVLAAAGLPAYEISNHARGGSECRHNVFIWQGGDYLAIGPGAHGRVTNADGVTLALSQHRDPAAWRGAVAATGCGLAEAEPMTVAQRCEELVMLGLRLTAGIDRQRFRQLTGRDVAAAVDRKWLMALAEGGFLVLDDKRLRATAAGRRCLDGVLARLLA